MFKPIVGSFALAAVLCACSSEPAQTSRSLSEGEQKQLFQRELTDRGYPQSRPRVDGKDRTLEAVFTFGKCKAELEKPLNSQGQAPIYLDEVTLPSWPGGRVEEVQGEGRRDMKERELATFMSRQYPRC